MKISVLIPTYNSSKTIRATLDSVLQQTVQPDEILVLDDGSTDDTVSLLNSYKGKVNVFQQGNRGVASARNVLCERANGDLIAFLDHDDIWHPAYLEVQRRHLEDYPDSVAFFTGHVNFYGYGAYRWENNEFDVEETPEVMSPLRFFKRYNKFNGLFSSASFFCIRKSVLSKIGSEPFLEQVSGVDDGYLCNLLPFFGCVVYTRLPLVAYRIIKEGQSTDKLKTFGLNVKMFELLERRYRNLLDRRLSTAFEMAYASKRRTYAKFLLGAGMTSDARAQLRHSLGNTKNPLSIVKSQALLLLSYMPSQLQPKYPTSYREWE